MHSINNANTIRDLIKNYCEVMLKKELIEKVTALAAPIVESEGFKLWHVDYYKDEYCF